MYNALEGIQKETTVAYFVVLTPDFLRMTEGNHEGLGVQAEIRAGRLPITSQKVTGYVSVLGWIKML
jgi:hypothetical protein